MYPVGLEPKVKTEPVPEEMKTELNVKREPKVKTEVNSEDAYARRRVHYDDDAKKTTFIPSKKGQTWRCQLRGLPDADPTS